MLPNSDAENTQKTYESNQRHPKNILGPKSSNGKVSLKQRMIRSKFVATMYDTQVAKCCNTKWDIKYHDKPDGITVYNFTPGQMVKMVCIVWTYPLKSYKK